MNEGIWYLVEIGGEPIEPIEEMDPLKDATFTRDGFGAIKIVNKEIWTWKMLERKGPRDRDGVHSMLFGQPIMAKEPYVPEIPKTDKLQEP